MFQLYSILFIEILFCGISYIISNGVFVNPTFMSYLVLTVSTVFGIIGNAGWGVVIADSTIAVVFVGLLMMLIAQIVAKKTTKRYRYKEVDECCEIVINRRMTRIVTVIVVILTGLYCWDILRAGASLGSVGLSAIYAVKGDHSGTNVIIRQGVKLVMACAFIHTFFFVNNFLINKKRTFDNFIFVIPAFCGMVCCIFTSVRTDILRILTAFAVVYCVLLFQKKRWQRKNLGRFIRKLTPIAISAALLMVAVKFIVKGETNATSQSYGIIQYIAYYVGSPIVVLGSKLEIGLRSFEGDVFGETTFNQVWLFLQRLGLFGNVQLREGSVNVWIEESKRITANVDTIFGPPMIDFGIIGMAIYIFVLYSLLNRFYYKYINRTATGPRRDLNLIVYSYFATIASMSYYTNLMNQFLTVYLVLTLAIIYFLWKYYRVKYDHDKIQS